MAHCTRPLPRQTRSSRLFPSLVFRSIPVSSPSAESQRDTAGIEAGLLFTTQVSPRELRRAMIRLYPQSEDSWRTRSTTLLLLLGLLLPFVQMAYAASGDPEAGLPACCRAHGKHQCFLRSSFLSGSASDQQATAHAAQINEKCCWPSRNTASADTSQLGLPGAQAICFGYGFANILTSRQATERVSRRVRANPKRGPPISSIFA